MTKLTQLAAAAVLAVGFAGQAMASPAFTIDPGAIPGGTIAPGPFSANSVAGTTSELLHLDSATGKAVGTGWGKFTSFNDPAGAGISPFVTGLQADYGLYMTFQLESVLTGGTLGLANSSYNVTKLTFQVWADPTMTSGAGGNVFTAANALTGTEASVSGTADDLYLAGGEIISGVAGFDALGGAFINAINSFAVCTGAGTADLGGVAIPNPLCAGGTGKAFFKEPDPFYTLAFSAFNNTTQGIDYSADGTLVSIQNAVGIIDFNGVPEPGTLALAGLALLGVGAARRVKKSA